MKTPKSSQPVRGSKTGRPIMALLDLLSRRMSLRILWELRGDRLRFRTLQQAAETNPSVLNTRLSELKHAGMVELNSEGYGLSRQGRELLEVMLPLNDWAKKWAKTLPPPPT